MQQSADALRQATAEPRGRRGTTAPSDPIDQARGQVGAQQDLARAMDKVAETLASGTGAGDAESRKLSEQLARAQDLREKLGASGRELGNAGRQNGRGGQNGQGGQTGTASRGDAAGPSQGSSGRAGEGQQGGGAGGTDLARLREEYMRQLRETKDLVDQMRREDPSFARGGNGGFTFEEATGMSVTAPGTEAFKQDFAKWDDLRRQATLALDAVETALSKKLQAKRSKDRLAAGADDKAPPQYKQQVDSYFKAIAKRKP